MKVVRKIKVGELEASVKVINKLGSAQLPAKSAYWLMRNLKVLGKEYDNFQCDKSILLEKYAERDIDGKYLMDEDKTKVRLTVETSKEYWEELNKLFSEEIEVPIFPMSINAFELAKLSALEVSLIEFLLEEENEESIVTH